MKELKGLWSWSEEDVLTDETEEGRGIVVGDFWGFVFVTTYTPTCLGNTKDWFCEFKNKLLL